LEGFQLVPDGADRKVCGFYTHSSPPYKYTYTQNLEMQ